MYFEYENDFLVKSRIHDGSSDELADIIEMLEDDIFDVLHTSPEELNNEPFLLLGETEDEEEAIEEGTLLAGHEEAMKLYRYLVDLHKRAEQARSLGGIRPTDSRRASERLLRSLLPPTPIQPIPMTDGEFSALLAHRADFNALLFRIALRERKSPEEVMREFEALRHRELKTITHKNK